MAPRVAELIQEQHLNVVVAFPDKGALKRYGNYLRLFGNGQQPVITKKERSASEANSIQIASDQKDTSEQVRGRDVILFDDMIDTGDTLRATTQRLKKEGAKSVTVVATHGFFSRKPDKPESSGIAIVDDPSIDRIIITDTVPPSEEVLAHKKIEVVPIAPLIAEVIDRMERRESIVDLVKDMSTEFERSYMRLTKINKYRRRAAKKMAS